jgi:hypothetical protein
MRFALLVVGSVATGASGVSANSGIIPGAYQMIQAVTGLGGDSAKGGIVSINLLQTYNNVMRQVASGGGAPPMGFQPSPVVVPPGSFPTMNGPGAGAGGANGFASQMLSEVRRNNRRMEDIAAYARNPAGWRGMPPH